MYLIQFQNNCRLWRCMGWAVSLGMSLQFRLEFGNIFSPSDRQQFQRPSPPQSGDGAHSSSQGAMSPCPATDPTTPLPIASQVQRFKGLTDTVTSPTGGLYQALQLPKRNSINNLEHYQKLFRNFFRNSRLPPMLELEAARNDTLI